MSEDGTVGKKGAPKGAPKDAVKGAMKGAILVKDERKKRQVALGAVLAPLMAPALARQGVVLAQIAPHWRAICPLLAEHSCPESVKGDVLTVAVASDGVKQELHYITPQVIEGITRLLGYAAVGRVRAVVRTLAGTRNEVARNEGSRGVVTSEVGDKAAGLCKSVADDDLRAALQGLGRQVLKDKK